MRKAKTIVPIVLAVVFLTGVLTVSGHAKKPPSPPGQSKPEPSVVSVTGAIVGEGDPAEISVLFVDSSFGDEAGAFIANPDYPPALKVTGPGKNRKRLRYYYCCHKDHVFVDSICGDTSHDPYYYKCLTIYDGQVERKTDRVHFPAGSRWVISWKETMGVLVEGTLAEEATYDVLEWSTQ